MRDSPYWNPKTETLPREDLRALQGIRLARLVDRAWHRSPYCRHLLDEAGVAPEDVRSFDDLRRLPFTARDEWMDCQAEKPPYGDLLAQSPEDAIRYHATSGSAGRTPLRVLDGRADWKWIAECWCYGFHGFGIRARDRVFFAFSYGTFIGFWGAHYATEKMGCLVLPSGNMSTSQRVHLIDDLEATVVCATPTYALRLAQEGVSLGIDLAAGSVKRLILSGEPAGSIPTRKRLIEKQWGAKAADTAGMTETGTITMFECEHQPGGTHIIEDHFIEEVIDPVTGETVDYGERGERVVTSFGRGMIPLIRYRTGDLVVKAPASTCSCGRTWDLYDGGIRGRVDDMLLVRGTNVYPRAVEAIVREYPGVDEFQIHLYTADGIRDEIEILCEVRPGYEDQWENIARRLRDDLSAHNEGLGFDVQSADPRSLPRFETNAKRVKDDRVVKGDR